MFYRRAIAVMVAAALVAAAGCSGDGKLYPVSGEVFLDGKPLQEGTIVFYPLSGNHDAAAGQIVEGKYSLNSIAGSQRVEIEASVLSDKTEPSAIDGKPVRVRISIIPKFYNRASSLKAEVSPTGENKFRFDLKSDITGPPN